MVGVTVLQPQAGTDDRPAQMKAAADSASPDSLGEKLPDLTVLYHLKATAAPDSTTSFRANLGGSLADVKNWHWAIVSARGVPPASPVALPPSETVPTPVISPAASNQLQTPGLATSNTHADSNPAPQ